MNLIKKHIFYIFLIVQAILWVLTSTVRNIASSDAMEAVAWGDLISLGTNKHPPLSGWMAGGLFNLLGQNDIAIYILGEICIVVGLIFVYKLAKYFLDEEKALCSSMIVSVCFYYTYHTFINNYNCNIVLMAIWPVITYYFYKSIRENSAKDWIIFGICSGLGFLAKYQIVLLFFALFLYLIFFERKQFQKKGIYISLVTGLLVILPHIIWLYKTDFFSLIYIMSRTEVSTGNTPQFLLKFGRIVFPIKFYLNQIMAIIPCMVLYLILALKEKNISLVDKNLPKSDKAFILIVGLLPIFILGLTGAIDNSRVIGAWGSAMLSYIGVIMFYFFPIKFSEKTFVFFVKWLYATVIMWIIGMVVFFMFQTQSEISYPVKTIMKDFDNIWTESTNNSKLKYVYGNIDCIFQFRLYNKQHPTAILETFGHDNPWIDKDDVKSSGVLIVGKKLEDTQQRIEAFEEMMTQKYDTQIIEYDYKICNILNNCDNYKLFYSIIPPEKQ